MQISAVAPFTDRETDSERVNLGLTVRNRQIDNGKGGERPSCPQIWAGAEAEKGELCRSFEINEISENGLALVFGAGRGGAGRRREPWAEASGGAKPRFPQRPAGGSAPCLFESLRRAEGQHRGKKTRGHRPQLPGTNQK